MTYVSLQKQFQYINLISTFCFICKATTKKLFDFKNVYEYTSHYQDFFDKVLSFLTNTLSYIQNSTKIYF